MNKRMGIAIVGASMRSTMLFAYVKRYPEKAFITGVFDLIPERAQFLLSEYGVKGVSYDSLQAAVDDTLAEAVFIGTPDFAHVEPACAALQAGKHVYCEKPMALTLADCDTIIDCANRSPAVFYVGKNLRHSPVHEHIHTAIKSGKLGRILTIEANEHYYGGRTYFRRWNRFRQYGGGLWVTKACHDFDLLNWMAGAPPKRVFACSALSHYKPRQEAGTHCRECAIAESCADRYDRAPGEKIWDELAQISEAKTGQPRDICLFNSDKDTFDNGMAVVEYANDVRATYTVNVVSARTTRQMLVAGTDGTIEGDVAQRTIRFTPRHVGETEVTDLSGKMHSGHGGADDRILDDFLLCCRTGQHPRSGADAGRLSLQVGLAARQSCDTGLPVLIKDVP